MRLATSYSTPSSGGTKQVTVNSDTAVQLDTNTPCKTVTLKADDDNSGNIYIGFSSSVSTASGFRLKAGQGISIDIDNLNKLWAIADADNQKLYVIWVR